MVAAIERAGVRSGAPGPWDGKITPLLAASVHYWRLRPSDWRAALTAVKEMGFHFVDTYVPWDVHEQSDGSFDFGRGKAALDVALFLRIAHELGLLAIVRPGPHINGELTHFGIPERVIWNEACQARGPSGAPVVLPILPRMFPVPSYASEAFRTEVEGYFHALAPILTPLCCAADGGGPIAMVQIDNEGAFYFRDGIYDQDYHPDAVTQYRAFLEARYGSSEALATAYPALARSRELTLENVAPPTKADVTAAEDLAHHLDWAAFHEHMLADALSRFRAALTDGGLPRLPTSHNFPLAESTTPLNIELIGQSVDLVGFDYYNRARPADRAAIARRTGELAVRCDARAQPCYAPEMGVGFPPYFPPLSMDDSCFTLLAALAYGLRGFNLYMAVERDRWIGAPVDRRGRLRPAAAFYTQLNAALERVSWFELRRRVPVRLVVPRAERRLARVLHAFGPASGALLAVSGLGPREACIESDAGFSGFDVAPVVDADTLLRAFEQSLEARGVPFAVVGGEQPESALAGADWVVVLTSGGFDDTLASALERAHARGARITVGPAMRAYDEAMRNLVSPWSLAVEPLLSTDPRAVDRAVAAALESIEMPALASDTEGIAATLHEDAAGVARVAFVLNTSENDLVARVTLGVDAAWDDLLEEDRLTSDDGVLEVRMRPRSVRMFGRVADAC